MIKDSSLMHKSCSACRGDTWPLHSQDIIDLLIELGNNWEINELGHLFKCYDFTDFITAMDFANKVAMIAEEECHHPNLAISWGLCKVEIWTHKISGLTESDFILAAKIDSVS